MNVTAGLWIDHLKAIILITFDGGERTLELFSHADIQSGMSEGRRTLASLRRPTPDGRTPAYTGQLNRYYTEVIEAIRDAEAILIFGPGPAKEELMGHLGRARLGDRVIGLEPAERMTETQIAARVRAFFHASVTGVEVA